MPAAAAGERDLSEFFLSTEPNVLENIWVRLFWGLYSEWGSCEDFFWRFVRGFRSAVWGRFAAGGGLVPPRAIAYWAPQATCTIVLSYNDERPTGLILYSKSPTPSSPLSLVPQEYSVPLSTIAHPNPFPIATPLTFPIKDLTRWGLKNSPKQLDPHIYNSPYSDTAAECPPAAINPIFMCCKSAMMTGESWFSVVPVPSWPSVLQPVTKSLPEWVRKIVWKRPLEHVTTRS